MFGLLVAPAGLIVQPTVSVQAVQPSAAASWASATTAQPAVSQIFPPVESSLLLADADIVEKPKSKAQLKIVSSWKP